MPELPEVETTCRGIAPHLTGRRICGITVREARLRWPVPKAVTRLAGLTMRSVQRRAKYLLIDCGKGHLILHLGMSGSLRILPAGTPAGKHDHFDLEFDDKLLRLRDPRRFGAVLWTEGPPSAHPLIASLGVEPLAGEFTGARLHALSRGRRVAIKLFLMNAHVVVGVGNIYASESLFLAGIHPSTRASRLSLKRCETLVAAIKQTLAASIEAGGSSLRDFVSSDGSAGYFQQNYWTYGRTGETCRRCGGSIRKSVMGQRSTFYCPGCQK